MHLQNTTTIKRKSISKRFFLRNGSATLSKSRIKNVFYSRCKRGLERISQILRDLGFNSHEISESKEPDRKTTYCFFDLQKRAL